MDAEAYGNNVFEVYLRGDKLADYDNQPSEFYKLKTKREQVEWLKDRGYDDWYADMDSDGWGELSVFSPGQIKSATDNIGTFDSREKDIRYSSRTRYSAGQMAVMKANLSHSKVYTKSSAMQLVNELAPKIRNRSFEVLADELWRGLNTFTSLDDKRTFASDMAEMFIDRMMVDTLVKNDEWDEAVEKMAYIKYGMSYLADMHPTEAMKIHCISCKF